MRYPKANITRRYTITPLHHHVIPSRYTITPLHQLYWSTEPNPHTHWQILPHYPNLLYRRQILPPNPNLPLLLPGAYGANYDLPSMPLQLLDMNRIVYVTNTSKIAKRLSLITRENNHVMSPAVTIAHWGWQEIALTTHKTGKVPPLLRYCCDIYPLSHISTPFFYIYPLSPWCPKTVNPLSLHIYMYPLWY